MLVRMNQASTAPESTRDRPAGSAAEVLWVALRLGLGSFGGPIAHLGYFERAYVRQRRWLGAEEYAAIVALCQMLPGPASSQTGFLIGLRRAGWPGAVAAWIGFTLPSALLMYAAARLLPDLHGALAVSALHGLKLAAVAVVAQALWSMAGKLCPDRGRSAIALAAAALLLIAPGAVAQFAALGLGASGGMLLCRRVAFPQAAGLHAAGTAPAWGALALFLALLLGLPLLAAVQPHGLAALAAIFYRAGALVFGGGHVVLPLLREALVPGGWIGDDSFLAGYGFAQALPGPLFALAAYLGAASAPAHPAAWALLATVCIFLPGLLLAAAGVTLWSRLTRHSMLRAAISGINAAVVGVLGAAFYDPVWTSAVHGGSDVAIGAAGLLLLQKWSAPPIAVVALCVAASLAAGFAG